MTKYLVKVIVAEMFIEATTKEEALKKVPGLLYKTLGIEITPSYKLEISEVPVPVKSEKS